MPAPPIKKPATAALPPNTRSINQALQASDALGALRLRMRDSQARLAALQPLLPAAMRPLIQAGPVDEEGYTLLAGNPAVAAKLRYLLPTLAQVLIEQGFAPLPIRVKLLTMR